MIQTDSGTGSRAMFQNTGSIAAVVWTSVDTALPGDTASSLIDTNSVTALDVGTTASAVNNVRVTDAATTGAPFFSAVGTDANIGIIIKGKNTGKVQLGTSSIAGLVSAQGINYIVGSGSSANTAVGTLNDANGTAMPVAAGLRVLYKMDSTFQAGANTFNLNSHGTDSVVQGTGTNSNLKTIFAAGAILDMAFDGTRWQVLSQNK